MATYSAALPTTGTLMDADIRADVSASAKSDLSGWTISYSLYIYATNAKGNPYSAYTSTGTLDIGGTRRVTYSGGYTFPSGHGVGYVFGLGASSYFLPVTPDGTGSVAVAFGFTDGSTNLLGSNSGSGSLTLPTIPRATQPTVSPTSGDTGSTFTIDHTPASGTFTHDVAYSIDGGATYTNIATGVTGTSTPWTPPHSLYPASTGGTAIIRVITNDSGGTPIGTKTVNLPLSVPTSVKPVVTAVSFVDDDANVVALTGAAGRFVQHRSVLKPTVSVTPPSGAAVSSSSVTMGGRTAASGVAFSGPIGLSGSVAFSASAVDARGRSSDIFNSTVSVTPYNLPYLPTPSVVRTSDAGGTLPAPTGTYLAITPNASVSSLLFSGSQKNQLEWMVRTQPVGGSWTTKQAWTTANVTSNTIWTTPVVLAGYSAASSFIVEVSVRDKFASAPFSDAAATKVVTVLVPSEAVAFDWDAGLGLGINTYRTPGFALDVKGDVQFQNDLAVTGSVTQNGKAVLDTDFVVPDATTSVKGISELATDAETITGTDDTLVVTPAGLKYAYNTRVGDVESAVTALQSEKLVRRKVPSSVTKTGGGTVVLDADGTIRVTASGVSAIQINGCLSVGKNTVFEMETQTSISTNVAFQLRKAGTNLTSTSYIYAGVYGTLTWIGTQGISGYSAIGNSQLLAVNGGNLAFSTLEFINSDTTASYNWQFRTSTRSSSQHTFYYASGENSSATKDHDGIDLIAGGTATFSVGTTIKIWEKE